MDKDKLNIYAGGVIYKTLDYLVGFCHTIAKEHDFWEPDEDGVVKKIS